jgi:type I restriction enzyme S subunit
VNLTRLGDVAKIYNGNSINEKVKATKFVGLLEGTEFIGTKDISYSSFVNYENGVRIPAVNASEFKLAKKGSVLLCAEGGSAGKKLAIIDRDVYFGNKLFCFECKDEVYSKFLFYYLQTPVFRSLFGQSLTGLIGGVSLEKIRNLPILLPSKSRQQEIANKIDDLITEIGVTRHNIFKQLDEISSLLFHAIRDLMNDPSIESRTTTLDKISENLDNRRIPITRDQRIPGEYPYYGASGIIDFVEGYIFEGDALLVSEDGANLLARTTPIAFSVSGKYWVNNHSHILKFDDRELQKYVEYFLENTKLDDFITGAAQPKLNQRALNTIPIRIPVEESDIKRIVKVISSLNELSSALAQNLQLRLKFTDDLVASLLDKYFAQEETTT